LIARGAAELDLKKEASEAQLLGAVRGALAPRARLERRLAAEGEVRGNLEGTGVVSLLRSVRRMRPDARVTLRDAWNLFECELREGRLAQLTRTAADGSFVRGERALPQLLGASAGRFSVAVAQGPLKHVFDGSLDEVLTRGALELGAQLDALSYPMLSRVARIVFDEDAYASLAGQSPGPMRQVVERLHAGEPPLKLGQRGEVGPSVLEAVLQDMGRRGAIRGVVGAGGEDLFGEARLARAREKPIGLSSPFSVPPRAQATEASVQAAHQALSPATQAVEAQVREVVRAVAPPPDAQAAERRDSVPPVPAPLERNDSLSQGHGGPRLEPVREAAPAGAGEAALRPSTPPAPSEARSSQPSARASSSAEPRPVGQAAATPRTTVDPSDVTDPGVVEARRSRSTLAAWAMALLGLFAAAFFAERMLAPPATPLQVEVIGEHAEQAKPAQPPASQSPVAPSAPTPPRAEAPSAPAAERAGASSGAEAQPEALGAPRDSGFQIYNGILEPGLVTSPEQGLLVVEASALRPGAQLSVDQQRVGTLPAKMPLSPGIHELALQYGDAVSYRFVSVRSGKTWVLREP
jgi:hypothetical protein